MPKQLYNVVELVNKLQAIASKLGDSKGESSLERSLTKVCVVGGQSSGKSSVLEAIMGQSFLPRGENLVTRCPIIIELHRTEDQSDERVEIIVDGKVGIWNIFTADGYNRIPDAIASESAYLCRREGRGDGVCDKPITLTYFSPNIPNLTLIDLPGLVKTAVGSQSRDMPQQIETMVKRFIEPENVIILAVSQATNDLATSDGLCMAEKVDPDGKRTIGVLTKLDLVEQGGNSKAVLTTLHNSAGGPRMFELGWFGVVNRSQTDLDAGLSIENAREKERAYFRTSGAFAGLSNVGTDALVHALSSILEQKIREQIPAIRAKIDTSLAEVDRELNGLGRVPASSEEYMILIQNLCEGFEALFKQVLNGEIEGVGGGFQLDELFVQKFPNELRASLAGLSKMCAADSVQLKMKRSQGYNGALGDALSGVRWLISEGVQMLQGPCLALVDDADSLLRSYVTKILSPQMAQHSSLSSLKKYEALKGEMFKICNEELDKLRDTAKKTLRTLIKMESQCPSPTIFDKIKSAKSPAGDAALHGGAVEEYVRAVMEKLQHMAPQTAVFNQVKPAEEGLLRVLYKSHHSAEAVEALMKEAPAVANRRAACLARQALLEKARSELNRSAQADDDAFLGA